MKKLIFLAIFVFNMLKWPIYILLGVIGGMLTGYLVNLIIKLPAIDNYFAYFIFGWLELCVLSLVILAIFPIIIEYIKVNIIKSKEVTENIYNKVIRK